MRLDALSWASDAAFDTGSRQSPLISNRAATGQELSGITREVALMLPTNGNIIVF
jgi:hypothetical protein